MSDWVWTGWNEFVGVPDLTGSMVGHFSVYCKVYGISCVSRSYSGPDPGGAGGVPLSPSETGHQTSDQYVKSAMGFPDFSFWIWNGYVPMYGPLDKILDPGLLFGRWQHRCGLPLSPLCQLVCIL